MGHSEVVFGPVRCCVAGTRPHGPGNQGGPVGTCWARCLRARLGGARSPASPSPTKQTRSIFRARVEALSPAQPHHAQFGGEHASPLGAGGPDATPTAPHMGYRFRIARGGRTGADHARLGDCWVVRHTQIPTLRMVLKPIPPLRTGCWSSNGTRCPLDSLGLATNARGGPLAVDFALPRPVVHQRLGAWGRPSADNE